MEGQLKMVEVLAVIFIMITVYWIDGKTFKEDK